MFTLYDIYCVSFALYSAKRCIVALYTKYDGKCIVLTREPENDAITHGDTEEGVSRTHLLWLSIPKFTENSLFDSNSIKTKISASFGIVEEKIFVKFTP